MHINKTAEHTISSLFKLPCKVFLTSFSAGEVLDNSLFYSHTLTFSSLHWKTRRSHTQRTILNNNSSCEWDGGIELTSRHLVIPERGALYRSVSSHCRKIKWSRCYANAARLSVSVIDGGLSSQRWPRRYNFKCEIFLRNKQHMDKVRGFWG